jgi:hypothetical protein
VTCLVEFTDQFEEWWKTLSEGEQDSVAAMVGVLETHGVNLKDPYSSGIKSSRHGHMRELKIQHQGDPYRVLYAFDPRRVAILLLGGNKAGDDRWYKKFVPIADNLYDEHLKELKKEGLVDG